MNILNIFKGPFRIFAREKVYGAQLGLGINFNEEYNSERTLSGLTK